MRGPIVGGWSPPHRGCSAWGGADGRSPAAPPAPPGTPGPLVGFGPGVEKGDGEGGGDEQVLRGCRPPGQPIMGPPIASSDVKGGGEVEERVVALRPLPPLPADMGLAMPAAKSARASRSPLDTLRPFPSQLLGPAGTSPGRSLQGWRGRAPGATRPGPLASGASLNSTRGSTQCHQGERQQELTQPSGHDQTGHGVVRPQRAHSTSFERTGSWRALRVRSMGSSLGRAEGASGSPWRSRYNTVSEHFSGLIPMAVRRSRGHGPPAARPAYASRHR